jgi:hypothetical protein
LTRTSSRRRSTRVQVAVRIEEGDVPESGTSRRHRARPHHRASSRGDARSADADLAGVTVVGLLAIGIDQPDLDAWDGPAHGPGLRPASDQRWWSPPARSRSSRSPRRRPRRWTRRRHRRPQLAVATRRSNSRTPARASRASGRAAQARSAGLGHGGPPRSLISRRASRGSKRSAMTQAAPALTARPRTVFRP